MSELGFIPRFRSRLLLEGKPWLTDEQYKELLDWYNYFVYHVYLNNKDNKNNLPGFVIYLKLFTDIFDVLLSALISGREIEMPRIDEDTKTIWFGIKIEPID